MDQLCINKRRDRWVGYLRGKINSCGIRGKFAKNKSGYIRPLDKFTFQNFIFDHGRVNLYVVRTSRYNMEICTNTVYPSTNSFIINYPNFNESKLRLCKVILRLSNK